MAKALALTSGGLDSILAAKLIQDQGIDVTGICFKSHFFGSRNAEKMAKQIGLPLEVIDFTDAHLEMVKNPKHGYGKNMNPCIDCHAMMLAYAGKLLEEKKADFLVTGEVLNQRPMSQNRKALDIVKRESGFEDKILRPLCAQNLPSTPMEEAGLVDRSKLLGISGKSRKAQMELAEQMGVKEYPSPAGGCLLTEPQFSNRLRDLFENGKTDVTSQDVALLKTGRHFRLSPHAKAISSRTQEEYKTLHELVTDEHILFNTTEYAGSTVVLIPQKEGDVPHEDIEKAARLAARYSKGREVEHVVIKYKRKSEEKNQYITVQPMTDEEIKPYLL